MNFDELSGLGKGLLTISAEEVLVNFSVELRENLRKRKQRMAVNLSRKNNRVKRAFQASQTLLSLGMSSNIDSISETPVVHIDEIDNDVENEVDEIDNEIDNDIEEDIDNSSNDTKNEEDDDDNYADETESLQADDQP